YKVYPSVANFLLIRFEDRDGKRASDADAFLRSRGIVIRDMKAYGLPDCLRLSIGTEEANDDVLDAFDAFAKAD
ncbi:MAG: histidinol-phosphate transaminase, partial [Pseudomonadota bacterium]|nr:histidinol-phosphate transaminase [Pseudomonadota bacterium]